jgi:hypothetical protein
VCLPRTEQSLLSLVILAASDWELECEWIETNRNSGIIELRIIDRNCSENDQRQAHRGGDARLQRGEDP